MSPRLRETMFLVVVGVVCVGTAAFRFLGLRNGFPDDHFIHLVGGWQMTQGEWPTKDFVDPGLPLMFTLSAAAQWLLGDSLYSEGVLVAFAFGVAAAFTAAAVRRLTGSIALALLAVIAEVAVFPRTYGYPKVLLYAIDFWLLAGYAARPTRGRMIALAVMVVAGFLFRHDHGLFLFAGGVLAVALTEPDGLKPAIQQAARFSAIVLALVLPYAMFVQVYTGWGLYIRTAIAFSAREAARQGHVWPSVFGADPLQAALLYECYLVPLVALAVVALNRRRPDARTLAAQIVPAAVVALLVDVAFIREPLNTRLPDAIVPLVVLGTWLVGRAWHTARTGMVMIPLSAAAVAIVGASVLAVGHTYEEIDRAGLLGGLRAIPGRFGVREDQLRERFNSYQIPGGEVRALRPFFRYLDRCTTRDHHLLNLGFAAEIPYFARRPFAGGISYFGGYPGIEAVQRRVLMRLHDQLTPFAILSSEFSDEFAGQFPLINDYVRTRYLPLTDVPVGGDLVMHILVDSMLPARGRDEETGFPCYR